MAEDSQLPAQASLDQLRAEASLEHATRLRDAGSIPRALEVVVEGKAFVNEDYSFLGLQLSVETRLLESELAAYMDLLRQSAKAAREARNLSRFIVWGRKKIKSEFVPVDDDLGDEIFDDNLVIRAYLAEWRVREFHGDLDRAEETFAALSDSFQDRSATLPYALLCAQYALGCQIKNRAFRRATESSSTADDIIPELAFWGPQELSCGPRRRPVKPQISWLILRRRTLSRRFAGCRRFWP